MLSSCLQDNIRLFQNTLGQSGDFYTKEMRLCGICCCVMFYDGISGSEKLWEQCLGELSHHKPFLSGKALAKYILQDARLPVEGKTVCMYEDAVEMLSSGFALLMIDGTRDAILVSAQNMKHRAVGEPTGEGNIRGSQEGFTDLLRVNLSLIRRLIRNDSLVMEVFTTNTTTKTEYALCYCRGYAPQKMVDQLRSRFADTVLPLLLDSSYFVPFIFSRWKGLLQPVSYTERPSAACAKLCEGKIIVLVNGSPSALIYPFFFAEHFECMDDYASTAYFAAINRILKYIAFFVSIFLPGIYVMAINFTPEIMPRILLETVLNGTQDTPLGALPEMILVLLVLEIIRIAGLRMPKAAGGSVSLIAALVVGSTAVEAGLLSTPLIICAAVSAIAMYTLPSLYEQIVLFRFIFLFLCGFLGQIGLALSIAFLLESICGADENGREYLYPLWPPQYVGLRDGLIRFPWNKLNQHGFTVKDIPQGEIK